MNSIESYLFYILNHNIFAGDDQNTMNLIIVDEKNKPHIMGLDSFERFKGEGCVWKTNWFYFILYLSPREMNDEIDNMRESCKKHGLKITLSDDFPKHLNVDELFVNG